MGEFQCAARNGSSLIPQDCNWPFCGCDPYANKVLEAIDESGVKMTHPPKQRKEYSPIDMEGAALEAMMWKPTGDLRWRNPAGVLEVLYERVTGERRWQPVQTIVES